ncbi:MULTISPECIES: DUF1120 domain-containing protein [unclassified Paludibacterium]|uniref:DUF1120 domain-containing protein n=1 Tax=unclassified Paludibacterium TaxID=2618429 RepID=UPI001C05E752|nr:DUF1120 domain-containing protein [Paludibacterium sp. B53371]BEV71861.1 hypothetical protein THUN1379_13430 [Paludibacterium sp. THUN1379]
MNMNLSKRLVLLALGLSASGLVMAAASSPIAVDGVIRVGACTPTLQNGGTFNFGNIYLNNGTGNLAPSPITQSVDVTCPAPQKVMFKLVDNKAASRTDTSTYSWGLGKDSANNNIGYYEIKLIEANSKIDDPGVAAKYIYTTNAGTSWADDGSSDRIGNFTTTNEQFSMKKASTTSATQDASTKFHMQFRVEPHIPSSYAPTGDESLDGSATITLTYS